MTSEEIPDEIPLLSRSGARKLLAWWLTIRIGVGGVFTVEDAEKMITAETGVKRVETDRRIRELREVSYVIANYRTDRSLLPAQHRLVRIGDEIWHKDYKWPSHRNCSALVRRAVFQRDGRECSICGVRDREPYPGRARAPGTDDHRAPPARVARRPVHDRELPS